MTTITKMVHLGPQCAVSPHMLVVEMDPYRHDGPNTWIDPNAPLLVRQKIFPTAANSKGSRVYQVQWSGLVLCEINIPKGTSEEEKQRTIDAAKDMVRLRWGSS